MHAVILSHRPPKPALIGQCQRQCVGLDIPI
jgi:hypothetical protein